MPQPAVSTGVLKDLVRQLFERPSVEGMLALSPADFEEFIAYVFARAGYTPVPVAAAGFRQEAGMELYLGEPSGPAVAHALALRRLPLDSVDTATVRRFLGALPAIGGTLGYLVTTSVFSQGAYDESARAPRLRLIQGDQLIRYITYVRGTRPEGFPAPAIAPDYLLHTGAIARRDPHQTRVLAIANQREGTGKTTTAFYLARRLAERGHRVLVVDLDPRAHLTRLVLGDRPVDGPTLTHYFARRATLAQLTRATPHPSLWIIPSHPEARPTSVSMSLLPKVELQFAVDLHEPEVAPRNQGAPGGFDWMLLDTPPGMSRAVRAGLAAAHDVLIPTTTAALAEAGDLGWLPDVADAMRALTGGGVRPLGYALTQWRPNEANPATLETARRLLAARGIRELPVPIPYEFRIDTARRHPPRGVWARLPLPWRGAAVSYRRLAADVSTRAGGV